MSTSFFVVNSIGIVLFLIPLTFKLGTDKDFVCGCRLPTIWCALDLSQSFVEWKNTFWFIAVDGKEDFSFGSSLWYDDLSCVTLFFMHPERTILSSRNACEFRFNWRLGSRHSMHFSMNLRCKCVNCSICSNEPCFRMIKAAKFNAFQGTQQQ